MSSFSGANSVEGGGALSSAAIDDAKLGIIIENRAKIPVFSSKYLHQAPCSKFPGGHKEQGRDETMVVLTS